MKRLLLISMIAAMLPLSLVAQDDDLYFVPTKKSVEKVTDNYGIPTAVYYSGSNRSIDEYNRRTKSHYEVIGADSTLNDTISFTAEKGVYPDSISDEDFELTKKMSRFEDYRLSDYDAFWAGYAAGRYDWAWHSPWYYTRYGWYDPWYYGRWRWYSGWYDPWYAYWYDPWYYGWYDPWYYGYGWYGPRYYGWYSGGSVGRPHVNTIGAGTIRRDGVTHSGYGRGGSPSRYSNGSRMSELRNRTVSGNSRNGRVNRGTSSRSYENSSYNRGTFSGNSGSFSSSRSSGGSFSSSSSRSSGGGFGGGGGSRGGGGGGGRMGGRR